MRTLARSHAGESERGCFMASKIININKVVWVPKDLLLEPDLSNSAKLVWMALALDVNDARIDPDQLYCPARIAERIGLSKPTVCCALSQLYIHKWLVQPEIWIKPPVQSTHTQSIHTPSHPTPPQAFYPIQNDPQMKSQPPIQGQVNAWHQAQTQLPPFPPQVGNQGLQTQAQAQEINQAQVLNEEQFQAQLAQIQAQIQAQARERRQALAATIFTPRYNYCKKVYIPVDLVNDTHLGAQARLIYGTLQTLPKYKRSSREATYTYTSIAKMLYLNVKTVRRALFKLRDEEWIDIRTMKKTKDKLFYISNPVRIKMLKAEHNLYRAKFRGEALMREALNLILEWDNGVDNATPDFLKNPYTHEQMHFDRYYEKQNVACEFNGEQHYRATDLYNQSAVAKQKRLDKTKQKICNERNITLLIFRWEDLSLARITEKIKQAIPWAPLRDLTGYNLLVNYLEKQMTNYREKILKAKNE